MKWPGWMRPSAPGCCCHAILAKRAPSGHGGMLPECAAWRAPPLPRTRRSESLSPRSVVLRSFQPSKEGSKAKPPGSGAMAARLVGAAAAGAGAESVGGGGREEVDADVACG